MITIYCSHKLYSFFGKAAFEPADEFHLSPLGDWNGHIFSIARRKCLIFINNKTYYSLFLTNVMKKDFVNFRELFLTRIVEQMRYDQVIKHEDHKILDDHFVNVALARTNNDKKTIGKINDLISLYKYYFHIENESLSYDNILSDNSLINERLSGSPQSRNKYIIPKKEMKELVAMY